MDVLWHEEDNLDYYSCLTAREIKIPSFKKLSPQLIERPPLVKWIQHVASSYCLHRATEHLAVALVDMFMDYFAVGKDQLLLMAISAITIAAKCEEQEIFIPRAQQLINLLPEGYSYKLSLCLQMELKILEYFKWKIVFPTVAHFLDYYMSDAFSDVCRDDEQAEHSTNHLANLVNKKDIHHTIDLLHSVVLLDIEYRSHLPSLVASIMIYVTRLYHSFEEPWNLMLAKLTGYSSKRFDQSLVSMMMDGLSDPIILNSDSHGNSSDVSLMSTSESPDAPLPEMPATNTESTSADDCMGRRSSCSMADSGYDSSDPLTPPSPQY